MALVIGVRPFSKRITRSSASRLKPSMKSSISACISSSHMALAAWSTSSARPAVLGDVGELVEEEVVAVLGSHVIQQEALLLSM
jgi:hypothetical protein